MGDAPMVEKLELFDMEPRFQMSSREVQDVVAMGIDPASGDWLALEAPALRAYWEDRVHLVERLEASRNELARG